MRLTDNEIRDIIRHLEAGKPLPDRYRFLLFDEKCFPLCPTSALQAAYVLVEALMPSSSSH
ncbi:MAG: hypothetical protein A2169_03350 [Deltaproteobacteria bacterium RBG_13_47_9]|nr:MAG: hypothetical protein A2169_03350 [Deltaproteobacteria bacterium RBG_13_47_9]